jgi:putative hemolysin
MNDLLLALFLLCLLFISAFVSSAETALFSLSPLTLRIYRSSTQLKQRLVGHLMERPRDLLVSILILNVCANLLVQNTVSTLFDPLPEWSLKVGVPLLLTLIFGEVLPKSIALPYNTAFALHIATPISKIMRMLKPLRTLLNMVASFLSRVLFFYLREEKAPTAEELRHIVALSRESGVLTAPEAELIAGSLDVKETTIKELMRPREEVLFYDIHEPLSVLRALFVEQQLTRVPVCEGSIDQLLGILPVRRFFLHHEAIHSNGDLISILKKPYFVPESTRGWTLLQNMREREEQMAIVVDEYGSIAGLITQEDLLGMIVGKITSRRGEGKNLYTLSGPDVIIASGKLELSDFTQIFGVELRGEHAVTLGGWLIEQLGDIPAAGTNYATKEFLFYVLAADPNRIRRIYVRRLRPVGTINRR